MKKVSEYDFRKKLEKAEKIKSRSKAAIILFIIVPLATIGIILNIVNFFSIASNDWYYNSLQKKQALTSILGIVLFILFFIFPLFSLSFANSVIDKFNSILDLQPSSEFKIQIDE